jgi:hypothetical protein
LSEPLVARTATPAHSAAGSATTPNLPRGPHAEARPVVYRHHAARREQHAAPQRAPAQASYDGSWFRLSVRRPTGTGERRTVCHERVLHTSTSTRGSCHPKLATKVRYECCDNLATSAASDTQRTLTALGVPNVCLVGRSMLWVTVVPVTVFPIWMGS